MKTDDKKLEILTKYLMMSKEEKNRNAEETYNLVRKISELFESEKVLFGKGFTALLMSLAAAAIDANIEKEIVMHTFSTLYEVMEKENKEKEE